MVDPLSAEQLVLLNDKLEVWRRQATEGNFEYRDYNRRSVEALEALLALAGIGAPMPGPEGFWKAPDRCPWCRGTSFARIDEPVAGGGFRPGLHARCVNCKGTVNGTIVFCPEPPWPPGAVDNGNAKRTGWRDFFLGKPMVTPFAFHRRDLHLAYEHGYTAARNFKEAGHD